MVCAKGTEKEQAASRRAVTLLLSECIAIAVSLHHWLMKQGHAKVYCSARWAVAFDKKCGAWHWCITVALAVLQTVIMVM